MARSKPSAEGELLTHRDEMNNHKHCIKYHKIDNSLTMPPIGEEINYYKWWTMAMVVVKDEDGGGTMAAVDGFFSCLLVLVVVIVTLFPSRG